VAAGVAAALAAACAASPPPTEPTVLRVVMADDWATAPVVGETIERFEREHEGVRVSITPSPFSQIPEVVASAVELEQAHDLAHWHAFAAAAAGLAEPLDDLWDDHGLRAEDYLAGAVQDVTWTGRRYGVPLDTNALVLMVNGPLLDAAGITADDVATMEGFRTAVDELLEQGGVEHAISVSASSWSAYGWIVANGGELVEFDDDGAPTFRFDDPATIAAVQLLVDLVSQGSAPPPFAPDLALDAVQAFAAGTVAMHTSGSWDLPVTRRAIDADLDLDGVRILPLPQADPSDPRTVLGGSSLFVPAGAPQPELAFELALALTEDEVALRLAAEEGRLPARERVFGHELFTDPQAEDLTAFVDQLDDAEVMPLIAYPPVAAAFREGLEDALALRRDPASAMAEVQAYAERWAAGG
jgi:multiple sugar transport system substrate-binding protein